MAGIYRACGRDNPNLYRLMYDRDLQRPLLLPGSEERAVIPAVRAAGGDRDLARAAWAFAHGMTILELSNRFPADADLDAAWRRGMGPLDPSGGPPAPNFRALARTDRRLPPGRAGRGRRHANDHQIGRRPFTNCLWRR